MVTTTAFTECTIEVVTAITGIMAITGAMVITGVMVVTIEAAAATTRTVTIEVPTVTTDVVATTGHLGSAIDGQR